MSNEERKRAESAVSFLRKALSAVESCSGSSDERFRRAKAAELIARAIDAGERLVSSSGKAVK